ncbi:MAG TPA: preprotein translocase subunit YajC [Microbacteriaceae bacterium]|nr:preprotein translocase subunit YajC [Microbacteriaceae bacterium]
MTFLRRGIAAIVLAGTAVVLAACSAVAPTTQQPAPGETAAPAADGGLFGGNFLTIAMVVLLVVLVFFMWRSSRKRKTEAQKLQSAMVPGVQVMTSFGLFGTLISVDEVAATAELEVSPGNIVKVHRQTLVKVVDPTAATAEAGSPRSVEEAMEIAEREQQAREGLTDAEIEREVAQMTGENFDEPRFGERIKNDDAAEGDAGSEGEAPKKP